MLHALYADFHKKAWEAIARDSNSTNPVDQNREDRWRDALQALEDIREGLAPLGASQS